MVNIGFCDEILERIMAIHLCFVTMKSAAKLLCADNPYGAAVRILSSMLFSNNEIIIICGKIIEPVIVPAAGVC